jgi:hypothetical protein
MRAGQTSDGDVRPAIFIPVKGIKVQFTQLGFGFSEQGQCAACGKQFIRTYPAQIGAWHWYPGYFYSIQFCSQECATNAINQRRENDERIAGERRSWG